MMQSGKRESPEVPVMVLVRYLLEVFSLKIESDEFIVGCNGKCEVPAMKRVIAPLQISSFQKLVDRVYDDVQIIEECPIEVPYDVRKTWHEPEYA